jgi:hypothetical protein
MLTKIAVILICLVLLFGFRPRKQRKDLSTKILLGVLIALVIATLIQAMLR